MTTMEIARAETPTDYAEARALFEEYAAGLGFSLCFQGFDREIEALPAIYGPPEGALLVLRSEQRACGCVGVRRLSGDTCEMKRLYVQVPFRAAGAGRQLALEALAVSRSLGYRRMVLDTLPTMQAARALYSALGFAEIPPYYEGPCGALYLEKML